jgi:two-component system, LytTR family, sensor kinase
MRRIGIASAIWLLVASVFVAQNIVSALGRHEPIHWLQVAVFELEYWTVFLAATPFFTAMARRRLPAQMLGGLTFALAQPVIAGALQWATLVALSAPHDARVQLVAMLSARYPFLVIVALWKYGVVIAVCTGLAYQQAARAQEIRAAHLESAFARAQLGALRMQLHPHFLFNALHSASILALTDADGAHRMLVQLADLVRETLDTAPEADVSLAQELDFIDRYLAIERVRFEDRLAVSYEISEEAEQVLVPNLILQPLVENAIHHAFARHSSARSIVVRGTIEGRWLRVDVEDDGPGLPSEWQFETWARTGLRNVQSRLDLANGIARPMEFSERSPTGLKVSLYLERQRADRSAA